MKLRQFGYREEMIQVREITIGDMIMSICQTLINKGHEDMEIRIVDIYMGEVTKWAGVKGILKHDWCANYKVKLYDFRCMHDNVTNTDYILLVTSDNVDE